MRTGGMEFISPMECQEARTVPQGNEWQCELKLDGYRAVGIRRGRSVKLMSRRGVDFGERFPQLVSALGRTGDGDFVVDGEVVAIDEQGRHSFALLQQSGGRRPLAQVRYFIFDLLAARGKSLIRLPLLERRERLENAFAEVPESVQVSPVLHGDRDVILEKVRQFHFEGVVAKKLDSVYEPGERPGTWLKTKTQRTDDFVIGGFTGAGRVDELLVGIREDKGVRFVGSVHAGFIPVTRRQTFRELLPLEAKSCPFFNLPEKHGRSPLNAARMQKARWVEPVRLAEIAFQEWTENQKLRSSRFVRLRDDK